MSSSRVKSAVFGAGRQQASSRAAGGLASAPLTRMEGEDRVFGRQKQAGEVAI